MDDRARVPFALLGVFLLVSSATLVTTIDPVRPASDSRTEVVVERTTAATQTVLREAVSAASRTAASEPVIQPADTTVGRALDESQPFRDALRLRIYVRARERLDGISVRQDGVAGAVSLPQTTTSAGVRRATERVHIERVDQNGTAIRVRIENVTMVTRRDGRIVARRSLSPTVTVATPVLAAHDRVSAYQKQLDAPLTEPGLSQRLTSQLYALAWSRGYLQYGGVPISNVISKQHLGVLTNRALLASQRSTIGHSDPRGRRTLYAAAGKTIARELTVATETDSRVSDLLLSGPTSPTDSEIQGLEPPQRSGPRETRRVAINGTADRAFLDLIDDGTLAASVDAAYSIEVRTLGRTDGTVTVDVTPPPSPGENWTLVDENVTHDRWTRNVSVSTPAVPDGWHALATYSHQTVTRQRITRTWEHRSEGENGTETVERQTETATDTARRDVSVVVAGRHTHTSDAPAGPVETAHERGAGPLSGPNLADARGQALRRVAPPGDHREYLLESAAQGTLHDESRTITLTHPANAAQWVYRDLMELRERVRAVHVDAELGRVGSFQTSPPRRLAEKIKRQRGRLLDAPEAYDGAATKARIAARVVYLERVEARLRARTERRTDRKNKFAETLGEAGTSMTELTESLEASERPVRSRRPRLAGPGGRLRVTADGAPAYLTQAELTHDQIPAIDDRSHPLITENVNVFSVPYQQASDVIVDGLLGRERHVRLRAAAQTLSATDEAIVGLERSNGTVDCHARGAEEPSEDRARYEGRLCRLKTKRDALRGRVSNAIEIVRASQRRVLDSRRIGDDAEDRERMVFDAAGRWDTTHDRALAYANGSYTRRLVALATRRANLTVAERDRLALRLNASRTATLRSERGQVGTGTVNASRTTTHAVVRGAARELTAPAAERATKRAYRRRMQRSFSSMPSGLPLAPVPGYWYATTNVWHVTVAGEYARFGVRISQGRPTTPGSEFVYARDGGPVGLDVDGDGVEERLGRSTRVDFRASATVLVVVPPGKSGVGDTNGVTVERSDGWPEPGGK